MINSYTRRTSYKKNTTQDEYHTRRTPYEKNATQEEYYTRKTPHQNETIHDYQKLTT